MFIYSILDILTSVFLVSWPSELSHGCSLMLLYCFIDYACSE